MPKGKTVTKCLLVVNSLNMYIIFTIYFNVTIVHVTQAAGHLNRTAKETVAQPAVTALHTQEDLSVKNWNTSAAEQTTFCTTEENDTILFNLTTTQRTYLALSRYKGPIDADFVALINPFWLDFSPPTERAHYTLGIIHACIMVIGLFGNSLVIFMFIRCRSIRTPANTLVINLAISDFCMLAKAPIVIYNSFLLGPALGDYVCRLYGFFGGLTGTASIATLTAISIDRYNVVVYPLNPLRATTKLRCRIMVLIVWIYSFIFSVTPALNIGFSKYVPEGFLTSCSFDYLDKTTKARIFMFIFFIFAWAVPFTIITFCYVYILKVVGAGAKIRSNKDKNKTEIKLAVIVIFVIVLWFAAWTPYAIVALLGISGNEDKITPLGSMIPAVFCKTAACIDPYVYAVTHPRFRMEFGRLFLGREQFPRYQTTYSRGAVSVVQNQRVRDIPEREKLNLSFKLKRKLSVSMSTRDEYTHKNIVTIPTVSFNVAKNTVINADAKV